MFSHFDTPQKQILLGNILLIVCCGFYLAWWLLAFRPVGAIKGMKTGWLLIPAALFGIAGVVFAIRGILAGPPAAPLIPGKVILWGGVGLYVLLALVTAGLFKRPITTELILIVGWGMLALAQVNVLLGAGRLSRAMAIGFVCAVAAALLISLVCYVLYYRLGPRAGYIGGMVPLLLAMAVLAGIAAATGVES